MKRIVFLVLIFFVKIVSAQVDTVRGYAPSYKNLIIKVFEYKNILTDDTVVLKNYLVDSLGFFYFTLTINHPKIVYFDLDYYYAFFYIEPNNNYEIRLPRRRNRNDQERLNPFFRPANVPVLVKKPENSLNYNIAKFDNFYSKILRQTLDKKKLYDTAVIQLEEYLQNIEKQYFIDYKKFKIATFKYYVFPQKRKNIIKKYLSRSKVLYNNTAYVVLFNNLFSNFFEYSDDLVNVGAVYKGLKNRNLDQIKLVLQNSGLFDENQELIELSILKGLYDLYYSLPNAGDDIINIVYQISQKSVYKEVRNTALELYNHFTLLRENYPAPHFNLPNKKEKYQTLKDFEGKFVYLQFCHPKSYACQKQLLLLKAYWKRHPKNLEIVTIFVADSIEEMKNFIKKNKYKWTFLYWDNDYNLLKKYNVKTFPTYYFIYPDGNLASNSAPTPEEDLSAFFLVINRKWQSKEVQKLKENYK